MSDAIGSVLDISDKLMSAMKNIDKQISDTQERANAMARAFDSAFSQIASGGGVQSFIKAISDAGTAMEQAASKFKGKGSGEGIGSVGTQAQTASEQITTLIGVIDALRQSMQQVGGGAGQSMSATLQQNAAEIASLKKQTEDYMVILKAIAQTQQGSNTGGSKSGGGKSSAVYTIEEAEALAKEADTIEKVRQAISALKSARDNLSTTDANYETQVRSLSAKIESLTAANKNATMSDNERAAAAEKAAAATEKVYKANAQAYQAQNYAKNTTYEGAMSFAESANTINRRTVAIQYLTEARKKLSATDANYEDQVRALNARIDELTQKNKEAAMTTTQLTAAQEKQQEAADWTKYTKSAGAALSYANTADTINKRTQAIKYLTEARKNLSTTDANYSRQLSQLNAKIKELTQKNKEAVAASKDLAASHRQVGNISAQLSRSFALLFSVSQIRQWVKNMVSVRAEFEMQQRALQALLASRSQADTIFQQTLTLATKSPFRAMQLVTYTKQLAAYRIETNKLYDTTKRLADVSAGLGVDMQRLILAYGQVKAAAFLKGTEVRQFTEAGVNMYSELQEYYEEVKGLSYTTADIVKMISEKKVTFEDVEAVFQRMTDRGGMFYNMQEIQAETIKGKIAKLGDVYDIMLNNIGKSSDGVINGVLDGTITVMRNWKAVLNVALLILSAWGAIKLNIAGLPAVIKTMTGNFKAFLSMVASAQGAMGKLRAATLLAKGAFNGLLGAGIFAIVNGIASYINKQREINKVFAETGKQFAEQRSNLMEIERKFDEAARGDGSEEDRVSGMRKQLAALSNAMEKEGFKGINAFDVPEEEVEETFRKQSAMYEQFQREILAIKRRVAEEGVGLEDAAADYDAAMAKAVSYASDMEYIVHEMETFYDKMSDGQKEIYDSISGGKLADETDLEYVERLYNGLEKLRDYWVASANRGSDVDRRALRQLLPYLAKTRDSFTDIRNEAERLNKVLQEAIPDEEALMKKSEEERKATLDAVAAAYSLGEYSKQLAYQKYQIQVEVDEESVDSAKSYLEESINEFLEENKFTVRVEAGAFDGANFFKSARDFLSGLKKSEKDYEDELERAMNSPKKYFDAAYFNKDSNSREFRDFYKDVMGEEASSVDTNPLIERNALINYLKEKKAGAEAALAENGISLDKKKGGGSSGNKYDVEQDRIKLLEEMAKRYEKLIELESEEAALQEVKTAYGDRMKNTGLASILGDDFTLDKEGLREAYMQILRWTSDAKKKATLQGNIAEVDIEIRKDELDKELENAKQAVEDAFEGLSLFRELENEGLTEREIKKLFPAAVSSYDDVEQTLLDNFQGKYGEKWEKANKELSDKLAQQRNKQQVDEMKDLLKAYKENLSEQLQADMWYEKERAKLEKYRGRIGEPTYAIMMENLNKAYRERTSKNAWETFTGSDYYINLFDSIDTQSTVSLYAMKEKLLELKESLKDLPPDQLSTVMDKIQELTDTINDRNPFVYLVNSFKSVGEARKELQISVGEYNQAVQDEQDAADNLTRKLEEQAAMEQRYGDESDEYADATTEVADAQYKLAKASQTVAAKQNEVAEKGDKVRSAYRKIGDALTKVSSELSDIGSNVQELSAALGDDGLAKDIEDAISVMSALIDTTSAVCDAISEIVKPVKDVSKEVADTTENVIEGMATLVDNAAKGTTAAAETTSSAIKTIEKASVILTVISAAIQLATVVANLFNKDDEIAEDIEDIQQSVDSLEYSLSKLEETAENAWSSLTLRTSTKESIENIEKQIEAYQEMIELEQSKKDTDESQIQEWRQTIEDLYDEIEELEDEMTEALGGFGSDENYKSAAEAFAEAWVDAFNESEDTLEALMDTFDDYFNNLLVKQITQRATSKYITPILEAFDEAVSEGSPGGNGGTDVTEEELAALKALAAENLEGYNDYLAELMEILDVLPSSSDTSLSALQQGIQSITEDTGAALESLLNSMRFYLATQQADVAIIRSAVVGMSGSSSSSNPMLTELKAQTALLESIDSTLGSVVKAGHSLGGKGIKVFA